MAATSSASPAAAAGLSRVQVTGLISLMLVSGVSNSMLNKFQDMQCVADCETARPKHYEQPVYQTLTMFVGETCCLVVFLAFRARRRLLRRRGGGTKLQQQAADKLRGRYAKVPIDDSGVVLNNESAITMRTVHDSEDDDEEGELDQQQGASLVQGGGSYTASATQEHEQMGMAAHKAVVGPDELVPGEQEPIPVEAEKLKGTKTLLMWLPAIFDICGTTLMNVGLLFVPVSVYQMLRGALVLWVGLFSVLFLGRKLPLAQWASLAIVMSGVAVVGLSNSFSTPAQTGPDGDAPGPNVDVGKAVLGAALVLFAQIFTASQFVIEEKIMTRYSLEPLRAVGLEGIFGLATTAALMPVLFVLFGRTSTGAGNSGFFDLPLGFSQTLASPAIWGTSLAICLSIALFNFSGLAVTKNVSATARSLIDTSRTVGIWAVSLLLGWEVLAPLQVIGFAMLVYGTLCFNEVLPFPIRYFRDHQQQQAVFLDDDGGNDAENAKGNMGQQGTSTKRPGFSRGRGSSSDASEVVLPRDGQTPSRLSGADETNERSPLLKARRVGEA